MSKPLELIAVAVVCLGVGALIGAQLFGEIPRTLAGPATVPDRPDGELPSRQPSDARAATRPGETGLVASLATAQHAPGRSSAAAAERRPPPPAAQLEPGDVAASVIRGSIVTLDGSPLTDVELELEPPSDAPRYQVRRATSDEDGRFAFVGLPRGAWKITGRHPEYVLQRRTSYPALVPSGASVDFIASPGIPVELSVVGPEAERARVAFRRVSDHGEAQWSSWTPDSPRIALLPGGWKVCAFVDPLEDWPSDRGWKLAPLASAERTVQVGAGDLSTVALELERVDCLYGTVKVPDGHQSDGSRPRMMLIEPENGTRADFESSGDRLARAVTADEQGRYGMFRLPYERWTAGVSLAWGMPSVVETVEVRGLTRLDFDLVGLDSEGSVVVDAFSPAGQRITDGLLFSIMHRAPGDEPDAYVWQSTRTKLEEGGSLRVFALPLDPDEAEEAGRKTELVLRAWMAGFATIDQPLRALDGERHRLSFAPSAELAVVLVGDGALRAMRRCSGRLDGPVYDSWARFDETENCITFTGVHPGRYTLTLTSRTNSSESSRREQLFHAPVDVGAGAQRLEVPMPVRSDLVIRCPGVKQDVNALLRGVDEDRTEDRSDSRSSTYARTTVDELGQVRFPDMLAGTYDLTIGSRMQRVRVPSPVIEFAGVLPDRFMFRLREGDSPLRRAGVRSGDLLVALDGETLGLEAVRERLEVLNTRSDDRVKLTVERDGRRLDLTLDASDLGEDEAFSAWLEPDLDGG